METAVRWRSGAATDTGRLRTLNEDRYWMDDDHGVFLVVDGVGGHAAGEIAAQTAVDAIQESSAGLLACDSGNAEQRVRTAIAAANNRIFEQAQTAEELRGMACVLTLAVVVDDRITIGHVGDSRMYLVWKGAIRKLTPDHSPVGEDEDSGALTEQQAMAHPRRNEVFRDVGTRPRGPGDAGFIDIRYCRFKPDAAFLLCTDGLTDHLTAARIRDIVSHYEGDPTRVAAALVAAANEAGGRDNITAVFVAGPQFQGCPASDTVELPRPAAPSAFAGRTAFLVYGLLIGMLVWAALRNVMR